jgi:hypothetical protein
MLKISKDGYQLVVNIYSDNDFIAIAEWMNGKLYLNNNPFTDCWSLEDGKILADFIKAGPPKLKYKITKVFDFIPNEVVSYPDNSNPGFITRYSEPVGSDDVEVV